MDRERYSVAGLFAAYAAQKAREEWQGEWAVALIYRPPAILAASLMLRLPVSATAVTLASLALVPGLPLFALYGGAHAYVAVALLAMLIVVLDCVDGTIARARQSTSRLGHYLDFMTDILFRIAFYAAIGIVAVRHPGQPSWLGAFAPAVTMLAAALTVFARLCRVYAGQLAGNAPRQEAAHTPRGAIAILFSAVSGIDHLLPLLVLLAGALGGLGWLVLWLLFYSALDFLYSQLEILPKLR